MSQLIIELNQHNFDPSIGQESLEGALGQFLAQSGLKHRSVRVHGSAGYVDFDDSESAKRAFQEINGMFHSLACDCISFSCRFHN